MSAHPALWWLFLNVLSAVVLAFYSMQEMACVSFNKIRLHYYVSKGIKRAIWIHYLLQHPARLFATTLFSVNVAMFIGSECARQTYIAWGLDPDMAPITQIVFIVIFAELAPMFAARRYAEHAAMLGAPILYASAKILTPLLWSLEMVSKMANRIAGGKEAQAPVALHQEDLQRILDIQDEDRITDTEGEEVNVVARNIFSLRDKDAKQVMQPIGAIAMLPSNATVGQMGRLLDEREVEHVPIYHRDITSIVGIVQARDLIRASDSRRLRDYARAPWFITQNTNAIQILKEFRHNNRHVAIVLDAQGLAIGMITLDDLTEEIFGKMSGMAHKISPLFMLDRIFPGNMLVSDFEKEFGVILDALHQDGDLTLADLMIRTLGHHPEAGESIFLPPFELTVKETTLMEIKKIHIANTVL